MKKSPSSSVKLYTNVGTFRKYAKLKPSVVSERVGISRSTLHRIEHGHIIPSVLVALQLAACLKVPVDDLFTLKNTPAVSNHLC